MASIGAWLEKSDINLPVLSTAEIYSEIKGMGFNTVKWLSLSHSEILSTEVRDFVKVNFPCLFIWDPKTPEGRKDYLFDVSSFDEIIKWSSETKINKDKHSYLITTKICPSKKGFVGSVFSDGIGGIFGETLHVPNNCNHRLLSQFNEDSIQKYLNQFSAEEFELMSLKFTDKSYLKRSDVNEIIKMFGHSKGYFEFVKGIQCGVEGFYVTGFGNNATFSFPHKLNSLLQQDLRSRFNKNQLD